MSSEPCEWFLNDGRPHREWCCATHRWAGGDCGIEVEDHPAQCPWADQDDEPETDMTPDALMERLLADARGEAVIGERVKVLCDIFDDVRQSFRLAMSGMHVPDDAIAEIDQTVLDYLTNNYGEE